MKPVKRILSINCERVNALIDMESDESYMAQETAARLGLSARRYSSPVAYPDGRIVKRPRLDAAGLGIGGELFPVRFVIVPSLSECEAIIGNEFLQYNHRWLRYLKTKGEFRIRAGRKRTGPYRLPSMRYRIQQ